MQTIQRCSSFNREFFLIDDNCFTKIGDIKRGENCTCKEYEKKGKCEHLEILKESLKDHCNWCSMVSYTPQMQEGICPRCGAETEYIRVR